MMKRHTFLFIIALSLAGICPSLAQSARSAGTRQADSQGFVVKTGDMVPDFTVTMFDGSTVNIRDLRGKVALIDFSGPFCKPCIAGLKRFDSEIFGRFEGQDLEVLVILGLYKNRSDVEKFRAEQGFDFPMGLDPEHTVLRKFFHGGIPRYFVIDRDGRILFHGPASKEDDTVAKVAAEIDKALKKR